MKCPECVKENLRSKVFYQGGSSTAMGFTPYYDEDGKYHCHNPNDHHASYSCSNGHSFSVTKKQPCPTCGEDWKE